MIVTVMGVSGSGKTTIAKLLAISLGWTFVEADECHSPANIAKMSRGTPLDDADRAAWLTALNGRLIRAGQQRESIVLACSALKQAYRAELARGGLSIQWIYLKGESWLIESRLTQRSGHYMKAAMLPSQLRTLEEPENTMVVDIAASPNAIVETILAALKNTAASKPGESTARRIPDRR